MTEHRLEGLRLYDTMTGAVRDFTPVRPGHASIYLCGATVQGLPHIGHVRSGVAFDVLRRWLTAKGYDVAFIRNVTDIDDKILNKAAEAGRPWWEWAATFERAFTAAYDALGVLPPSAEPRATGHITEMVTLVDELVERLGIGGFAGTSIRRLSGGQRQRVALAAALVADPEVAFLDEPSAGLDPYARRDVWDLVRAAADRGCAAVVTTHSFEEAARLADRVVIIAAGRVVADGTVGQLAPDGDLEAAFFETTRTAGR